MKVYECPLCGGEGTPDEREPAEVAGVVFRSIICDSPSGPVGHPFPVRWLEGRVASSEEVEGFEARFTWVRAPFEEGSAIAVAFADRDPIQAWIESHEIDDGYRVLVRL